MLDLDIDRSTITLDGKTFPAVGLVCPPTEYDIKQGFSDYDLCLGAILRRTAKVPPGYPVTREVYIPAENGVLIHVQERDSSDLLDVAMVAPTCEAHFDNNSESSTYLPMHLTLVGGVDIHKYELGARSPLRFDWRECEPDWVAESIERWSVLRTPKLPDGPKVQMIPLTVLRDLELKYVEATQ